MNRLLVFIFGFLATLVLAISAKAAPSHRWVVMTGATLNSEASRVSGVNETRSSRVVDSGGHSWSGLLMPATLKVIYLQPKSMVVGQYTTFQSNSGGELVQVDGRRDEYRLGYKIIFDSETALRASVGGHIGWVTERVKTSVGSLASDQSGKGEPLVSVSASAFGTILNRVMLEGEIMASSSETLTQPAPMLAFGFNIGWVF